MYYYNSMNGFSLSYVVDRRSFEDATQVDDHVEPRAGVLRRRTARCCCSGSRGGGHRLFAREYVFEDGKFVSGVGDEVRGDVLDEHVVVLPLEPRESVLELGLGQRVATVGVETPVDQRRDLVLPLAAQVGEGGVVVDERGAGEADAVEIEDDFWGREGARNRC